MRETTRPVRVLFAHLGEEALRGSEHVVLTLLAHLDPARYRLTVWSNSRALVEACRPFGVRAEHDRFGFFLMPGAPFHPRRYWRQFTRARQLLREESIDLVHAHNLPVLQWVYPAALLAGVPVIGHIHFEESRRGRYRFLAHAADLLLAVSFAVARPYLEEDGLDPARLRVVYNGIDPNRFRCTDPSVLRTQLGLPSDAVIVGSVGALVPCKGHDLLVRAVHRLAGEFADLHLVIAGEGPERPALETLARELGINDRVHLMGSLDDPSPVYAGCDVFALASRSEAFGLVLVEASLFGKPLIATDSGGMAEVVHDGEAGFVVPTEDGEALVRAMRTLLADPALRQRLGQAAAAHARSRFSVEAMVSGIERAYADVLGADPTLAGGVRALWRKRGPYLRALRGPRGPS